MGNNREVNRIAVKAGAWYLISEILIRGISFLSTPIFTRLLSKAVYGDVKTYESWLYLLMPILSLGIYNSIERAKFDFESKFDEYVSSAVFLIIIFNISLSALSTLFKTELAIFLGCSEFAVVLIFWYTAFYTTILCVQKRERQLLEYKTSVLISIVSSVLPVIISVYCVLSYGKNTTEQVLTDIRIFSFYVPIIILGMGVAALSLLRGKKFISIQYWTYAVKFSAPFIFYSISMQILNQSDKIMIKKICGSDAAGMFAVATTVVYIMDVLNNAIQSAWLPWMFENLNDGNLKHIKKTWGTMLVIMGGLTWLITMLSPELTYFLGGKQYYEASWLIPAMVTGSLIHFISVGYTNVEKFYKKTSCAAIASLFAMGINLALNYTFITKYGYHAAAYTTAASYFLSVILHWIFMKKYSIENILPIRNTLLIIAIFICLNLLSIVFYEIPFYCRWGTITIVLLVVFVRYRNIILKVLHEKKLT